MPTKRLFLICNPALLSSAKWPMAKAPVEVQLKLAEIWCRQLERAMPRSTFVIADSCTNVSEVYLVTTDREDLQAIPTKWDDAAVAEILAMIKKEIEG